MNLFPFFFKLAISKSEINFHKGILKMNKNQTKTLTFKQQIKRYKDLKHKKLIIHSIFTPLTLL